MNAQRLGATALRRVATKPPSTFFTHNVARTILASNISATQTRSVTTEKLTPTESNSLLASQRLKRPVSPHMTIYDPNQVWLGGSIWQRFTGMGFSGALYLYAGAYLVAPLLGWHLESASLAAFVGGLPVVVKGGLKFLIAWPFVFHSVNGVRHLVYDLGIGFAKKQIRQGGWISWGVSLAIGLGLVVLI